MTENALFVRRKQKSVGPKKCWVKTSTYVHKLRKFEQIYIPLFPYYYSNDCSNIPFFKYYSIREKIVKEVFF